MKRAGALFDRIANFGNLCEAARLARRGKRFAGSALAFESEREHELLRLEEELRSGAYRPGPFREFVVREPKERKISAPPFRDRVVHHAVIRIIEPFLDARLIPHTYACRVGKGTHRAIVQCGRWCSRFPLALRCDIRKFFPSIDHDLLKSKVRRVFKDALLLALLDAIVDGSNPQEPVSSWFLGDGLFTPTERRRGLPIGALTSQWFANLYLNSLDQFVTREIRPGGYLRYMDDFLVFGRERGVLLEARDRIARFLEGDRLRLHERKSVVIPTRTGVPFLGWRVFPSFRLLRGANKRRARRQMRRLARAYRQERLGVGDVRQSVRSWLGHAMWGDTWRLRKRIVEDVVFRCRKGTGRRRLARVSRGLLEQHWNELPRHEPQRQFHANSNQ